MKKLIIKGLLFGLLSLIIPYINYSIDIKKTLNSTAIIKAAELIVDNHHVKNLLNFDERIFQKTIIEKGVPHECIVIGSSRSMSLSGSHYNESSFFNHSVSSGTLNDYYALIDIYEQKHHTLPSKIIIGIDDWIFEEKTFGLSKPVEKI